NRLRSILYARPLLHYTGAAAWRTHPDLLCPPRRACRDERYRPDQQRHVGRRGRPAPGTPGDGLRAAADAGARPNTQRGRVPRETSLHVLLPWPVGAYGHIDHVRGWGGGRQAPGGAMTVPHYSAGQGTGPP